MSKMDRRLKRLMTRPYSIRLIYSQDDECWIATVPELPGCIADGKTPQRALIELEDAKALWFDVTLEGGEKIPQPECY